MWEATSFCCRRSTLQTSDQVSISVRSYAHLTWTKTIKNIRSTVNLAPTDTQFDHVWSVGSCPFFMCFLTAGKHLQGDDDLVVSYGLCRNIPEQSRWHEKLKNRFSWGLYKWAEWRKKSATQIIRIGEENLWKSVQQLVHKPRPNKHTHTHI